MAFIEVLGLGYTLPAKRLLFREVEFNATSGHGFDRFIEFGQDGAVVEQQQHAA